MSSLDRAVELVDQLINAGVRAGLDPDKARAPAVILWPPAHVFDMPCGSTASFSAALIVSAPLGPGRLSWAALETLLAEVRAVIDVERCELATVPVGGVDHPAYLIHFTEVIDD